MTTMTCYLLVLTIDTPAVGRVTREDQRRIKAALYYYRHTKEIEKSLQSYCRSQTSCKIMYETKCVFHYFVETPVETAQM